MFEPDATLVGGILNCLRIADLAERHSIEVIPHVGGPTVVGLAANLHWATAARVRLCEYDIDSHQPMITDIGDNPGLALVDLAGGTITAPTGPGLGVHVDEDLLDDHPYVPGDTYTDLFPEHESGRTTRRSTVEGRMNRGDQPPRPAHPVVAEPITFNLVSDDPGPTAGRSRTGRRRPQHHLVDRCGCAAKRDRSTKELHMNADTITIDIRRGVRAVVEQGGTSWATTT